MSAAPAHRSEAAAWLVVIAGVAAALHVGKLPPAIPVLRESLGIGLVQAGFLLSAVQIAGMTTGLLIGRLADGLGLQRSMVVGLCVLALASVAGALMGGAQALLWLRGIEGLGFLLVVLPAPSLIRQRVRPERLSRVLGWWSAYMPLGTALALLIGPWFTETLGWPAWWGLLGGVSLCMAVMVARLPAGEAQTARVTAPAAALPSAQAAIPWWRPIQHTLRAPGPWLVATCFCLYAAQWLSVIGFLPSIYREAGVAGAWVGVLTAGVAAINIVGNVMSGKLLHRSWAPVHLLSLASACMALGAAMAFGEWGAAGPLPPPWRYAGVLLFSCVGGLIPGTLFSLAVRVAPNDRTVAPTVGWMQQWSALGQFAGPPIVAWVAQQSGGWRWTWVVTGGCAAGCALLGGVLQQRLAPAGAAHAHPH